MIIHIKGPTGSGKTTISKRISNKINNVTIVDTDDIDDKNSLILLKNFSSLEKISDIKLFDKKVAELNKKDLNKVLSKNKDKNIVFVGHLHGGFNILEKYIKKTYSIKIDNDKLWRQYSLRTLDQIYKNYNAIKKLLNGKKDQTKIHNILCYKYGIRNGFECQSPEFFKKILKNNKEEAKKKRFFYGTSEEIYKDILKLLM